MDKKLLGEYATLKEIVKNSEVRIKEIGLEIKKSITESGADKIDTDYGTFSLVPKPIWKFSKAVEEVETRLEELKAEEKAKGVATMTTRNDLVFHAA